MTTIRVYKFLDIDPNVELSFAVQGWITTPPTADTTAEMVHDSIIAARTALMAAQTAAKKGV